jgi:hypothetical protein
MPNKDGGHGLSGVQTSAQPKAAPHMNSSSNNEDCMRTAVAAFCALALCACAGAHPGPEDSWKQAREEIHRQAQAGNLTPLREQEQLRDAFRCIYGPEPQVMSFYAYTISLMQRVQSGTLSLEKARELTKIRAKQVMAALQRERQFEGCAWSACSGP